MRRLLVGMVVAAAAALVPTWAMAGNQEVAEQIAAGLRDSGQLHGYKIGVKYQEGTAWLRGQVTTREQLDTALRLVSATPGVTRVVNNLSVAGETTAATPIAEPATGRSLQQVDGALAAERLPRSVSRDMRGPQVTRLAAGPEIPSQAPQIDLPRPVGVAERVPSNFAPAARPQVNVTALQEPTLAAPEPATPMLAAPQMQPQAVIQPVSVTQPTMMAQSSAMPNAVAPRNSRPLPIAFLQPPVPTPAPAGPMPAAPGGMVPGPVAPGNGQPMPVPGPGMAPVPAGAGAVQYDHPNCPNYAWPSYAAYPNYAAVTYPKQYSPTAWPYIGPFYPYPQVPLGWRKVVLEWHDGWWQMNFDDGSSKGMFSGIFRPFHRAP